MTVALWIGQGLLAAVFVGAAVTKLKNNRETYAAARPPMTTFALHMPTWLFKTLGVMELAGAIGVIVPAATGVAPWLTTAAAIGLGLLMVGALIDHARREERQAYPINVVLIAVAAFVAAGRLAN